ncbi:isoamyl acetate-hydrolyzing esterase 1 homolog isoform X2 [Hydra vulgaris]|uniref:Isoamyl acetate-hydrolyzing esterase 1 homolog isoform X2 n=1 Tax=Hydra vulgaris TaxID=6087 RepID=A0ABM4B6F1_HYDVU
MATLCNRLTKKLYLIGDSNTEKASFNNGFAAKLTEEYSRRLDVVNRGFSGYTTQHIRIMIPKLLKNDNLLIGCIHTAVILLSTNDSVDPELDKRAVDVKKSKENLEFIIKYLKDNGVLNIILLTPPPIDGEKWHDFMMETQNRPGSFSNKRVLNYVKMCTELALEQQIHIVDLYDCIIKLENWKQYFYDGLHFSQSGNLLVFYKLKEVLDVLLADVVPAYPDWKDIDLNNPDISLG